MPRFGKLFPAKSFPLVVLILAVLYLRLNVGVVKESVFLTAKTNAMVCWLFVGSANFSAAFALLGGQALVEQWVLLLNLQTAFLSPPVAMAAFYLNGVSPPHVSLNQIFAIVLLYQFPGIGLWLPQVLYGR